MRKNLKAKIYGRVRGVGFRFSAQSRALELGLKGFARNEPDDSVYLEAEGEENALKKFLDWCRNGPSFAEVERVDFNFGDEIKDYKDFAIE